ncbi:hypothetical protein [Deinococcus soli (ex Cha et al. 2016)]|uniref:Uncharacterized protein n=1 Tax=Deinococcus soli (ex Cha et al. 2016) TaxID=1309411 RepID=A0ACC6KP05_9DEIO|nr:hypothetical protein [Deinococcus soli (ex Cha et al. 2016)]MDR6330592.1 hypothetical protein [Deinococcus soli (ex Cha et al. 2016)]MDR6754369.1 hypothetical protein [Deinococcus soli (ex Cha et al. 2016)]
MTQPRLLDPGAPSIQDLAVQLAAAIAALPSVVAQRLLDNHDRLQRIASNSASKLRRDWGLDAPARPAQAYPTTPLDQCL